MTRTGRTLLLIWMIGIAIITVTSRVQNFLDRFDRYFTPLSVVAGMAWLVVVVLSLYGISVAVRYLLRKLFWRVGRRLALSYFLIGVLPFVFFFILMVITTYIMAGVLSQAAFRDERQATLGRLDRWNLEYALTGAKPVQAAGTLEIYDTRGGSADRLPQWLRKSAFLGFARRGDEALFVSGRIYDHGVRARGVVFVQPIDATWRGALEKKNGMLTSLFIAKGMDNKHIRLNRNFSVGNTSLEAAGNRSVEDPDNELLRFLRTVWRRNAVVWFDWTSFAEWESGETPDGRFVALLSNPWTNLGDFYFGSSEYLKAIFSILGGIAALQAVLYIMAAMLAAWLIFSISRAVNRIERGTKAVERGDFSYRINLRARNQLGQVAQSFDHMTESIASLMVRVAGQERLQSEIDIAASIQRNLLPKEGPQFRGVSFSAHFEPTASIGGDYYDVFTIDRSRLAVAIGDVSGHGLSTGLVMAMVKAAITTLVEEGADEESLFRRLNDLVLRSTEKRSFMTLAFTIFDLDKGTVRHTNAGHLYPYILQKGQPLRALESPSLPLGVRPEITPRTISVDLHEGDVIVYLSDGIVEAQNPLGDPLGFVKLESLLLSHSGEEPAQIQRAILEDVSKHSGDRPADDDRTIMILRFDSIGLTARKRPYADEELVPVTP